MSTWLLLHYKLPTKPSALRVYTWRKLRRLGAILLHDLCAQPGIDPAKDLGRDFRPGDNRALLGNRTCGSLVVLALYGLQLELD